MAEGLYSIYTSLKSLTIPVTNNLQLKDEA